VIRPAIAGFGVGLLALVIPGVLGTGYGWVQETLSRDGLLAIPLWMVLVLPFAKILATSMSIGSGGSGGVFGPGMVIGGFLGAGAWRLLEPVAPGVPFEPSGFVIVGMMALFGSVAHAPLAVMLMVAEMTGNLAMLAPAMVAIGVASLIVGDTSIYTSQLRTRVDSPGHRFRVALPLLGAIAVGEAAREPRAVIRAGETVGTARARLELAGVPGAPVVEAGDRLVGSLDLDMLTEQPDDALVTPAGTIREPILSTDDRLDDALGDLADHRREWAPVEADGRLAGVLSTRDAIAAYRAALSSNVRQIRSLRAGGVVIEATLAPGSALVGRAVAAVPWPRDAVVVAIERGEVLLVPRGDLQLAAGDHLSIFAAPEARAAVDALLGPASDQPGR
jgi:CIC family chloride channel protein